VRYRLAAVYAHPDDDTYGVAGSLALDGPEAIDYCLIVASSGEDGPIADPSLATRETLARVREAEQREALGRLGFAGAPLHFLRYPDGGVKHADHAEFAGRVGALLQGFRPHVVVTFGPEGITRHEDHIAVSQVATEAFHLARAGVGDGEGSFLRLLYSAIPQTDLDRLWAELRSRGMQLLDPDAPFMPTGVPDGAITHRVDCRPVFRRKMDAIRAHRTQQVETDFIPEDLQPQVFGEECFVQAWPPVTEPDHPVRGRIFDDLPEVTT
jgi:LmbE family N-acetylglucosaminyl deacetylase